MHHAVVCELSDIEYTIPQKWCPMYLSMNSVKKYFQLNVNALRVIFFTPWILILKTNFIPKVELPFGTDCIRSLNVFTFYIDAGYKTMHNRRSLKVIRTLLFQAKIERFVIKPQKLNKKHTFISVYFSLSYVNNFLSLLIFASKL